MATEVIKIIDPDDGPGTDYLSLNAWEAAQQGDLTGARDEIAIAECRSSSGSADTTRTAVVGWTTDPTRYIEIKDHPDEYHDGVWDTNVYRYEITDYGGVALSLEENYIRLKGLQIRTPSIDAAGGHVIKVFNIVAGGSDIRIEKCIIRGANSGTYMQDGINLYDADAVVKVGNNIIYDINTTLSNQCIYNFGTAYVYNNTFIGGIYTIRDDSSQLLTAINNICQGAGTRSINNQMNVNSGYNVVEESGLQSAHGTTHATGTATSYEANKLNDSGGGLSAAQVGSIVKNTTDNTYSYVTVVDSDIQLTLNSDIFNDGNENYEVYTNKVGTVNFDGITYLLDSADTVAKDKGFDLTSDENYPITDDILEITRSGDWDIGAHEYTVSSLIVTPSPITTVASGVNPGVIYGSISLTPTQISAITGGVDPTVILGSIGLTPTPVSAIAGGVNPLVVLGSVAITPGTISAITARNNPNVILGSLSLTPGGINAITGGVDPIVILGSVSITPQALFAIASGVDPTVIEGGDIVITPAAISAIVDGVNPQILLGSLSITPDHMAIITDKNDPDVILGSITITPALISALVAGQNPEVVLGSITITPAQMSAIIAGIDPTVTIITPVPELPRHIFSKEINKIFSKELIGKGISSESGIIEDFLYGTFNGTDAYVSIADNDLFTFGDESDDSPFSISAWVYMNDATWFSIIVKSTVGGDYGGYEFREWNLGLSLDDRLFFTCFDANASAHIQIYTAPLTSYEGQWIHVIVTYNANGDSNGLKIYINGILQSVTENNYLNYIAMHNTTRLIEIGKYLSFYSDGKIRDIKIFDIELTNVQVLNEYQNQNKITDLVAYYKLKSDVKDYGPNALHGTNHNVTFLKIPKHIFSKQINKTFEV